MFTTFWAKPFCGFVLMFIWFQKFKKIRKKMTKIFCNETICWLQLKCRNLFVHFFFFLFYLKWVIQWNIKHINNWSDYWKNNFSLKKCTFLFYNKCIKSNYFFNFGPKALFYNFFTQWFSWPSFLSLCFGPYLSYPFSQGQGWTKLNVG